MKAAFIIPARNKEKWVGMAVESALLKLRDTLGLVPAGATA